MSTLLADIQLYICTDLATNLINHFRSLALNDTVTLLTPILLPLEQDELSLRVDPFETFGREISRHVLKVRHIPYWQAIGITTTHMPFITRAASIILVCDSDNTTNRNLQVIDQVQTVARLRPLIILETYKINRNQTPTVQ